MADAALVFRYNVDAVREQGLTQTLADLAQLELAIPVEQMRAWLSHMANGEFDALPPERRDH